MTDLTKLIERISRKISNAAFKKRVALSKLDHTVIVDRDSANEETLRDMGYTEGDK